MDAVDYGRHPEIFADGVSFAWIFNGLARVQLFRWSKSGANQWEKQIVVELVVPANSVSPGTLAQWQAQFGVQGANIASLEDNRLPAPH